MIVIVVHPDAYVDARFLILVIAKRVATVQVAQVTLLLSLFIIVDDLKLDQWLWFVVR